MTLTARYTRTAMLLHWAVAALILGNLLLIWTVDLLPEDAVRPAINTHKSIGVTVLGLALLRLLWRAAHPAPKLPAAYPRWERAAAHAAHAGLYVLIFAIPLSGWLHDSAWNGAAAHPMRWFGLFPWPRIAWVADLDPARKDVLHAQFGALHAWLGYGLYVLLAAHLLGTAKHQWLDGHAELQRIVPWGVRGWNLPSDPILTKLTAVLAGLSVTACSVVGVRSVEEPAFTVTDRVGALEIRQYGARIAAQTAVVADVEGARSAGFRRIAGYIFGGNHARSSIAMTAPVQQSAQSIAMTAPVAQAPGADGVQVIQFFMPKQYTLDTLPVPNDPAVQLVAVPGQAMAVLRFSGSIAPAAVAERQQALLDGLRGSAWQPSGPVAAWFYDPPWTLPPFRRNEVAVPVTRP